MPSVLGYIPSGSRYGNIPNELVRIAGSPFLDNHYHGYQYYTNFQSNNKNGTHSVGLIVSTLHPLTLFSSFLEIYLDSTTTGNKVAQLPCLTAWNLWS